jgi:hypothetical protein
MRQPPAMRRRARAMRPSLAGGVLVCPQSPPAISAKPCPFPKSRLIIADQIVTTNISSAIHQLNIGSSPYLINVIGRLIKLCLTQPRVEHKA